MLVCCVIGGVSQWALEASEQNEAWMRSIIPRLSVPNKRYEFCLLKAGYRNPRGPLQCWGGPWCKCVPAYMRVCVTHANACVCVHLHCRVVQNAERNPANSPFVSVDSVPGSGDLEGEAGGGGGGGDMPRLLHSRSAPMKLEKYCVNFSHQSCNSGVIKRLKSPAATLARSFDVAL